MSGWIKLKMKSKFKCVEALACADIRNEIKRLRKIEQKKRGRDRWYVVIEEIFSKESRALNRELGVNSLNYYNNENMKKTKHEPINRKADQNDFLKANWDNPLREILLKLDRIIENQLLSLSIDKDHRKKDKNNENVNIKTPDKDLSRRRPRTFLDDVAKTQDRELQKSDFIDKIINEFIESHGSYVVISRGKERAAAGKLCIQYKAAYPDNGIDDLISDLRFYFDLCNGIKDDWYYKNMSLSLIVSKFNEINRIIASQYSHIDYAHCFS
jgi:hypothetical protein